MTRDEIRLECLKLSHAFSQTIEQVLGRAAEYEKFVVGQDESRPDSSADAQIAPIKRGPGRPPKNGGNPIDSRE